MGFLRDSCYRDLFNTLCSKPGTYKPCSVVHLRHAPGENKPYIKIKMEHEGTFWDIIGTLCDMRGHDWDSWGALGGPWGPLRVLSRVPGGAWGSLGDMWVNTEKRQLYGGKSEKLRLLAVSMLKNVRFIAVKVRIPKIDTSKPAYTAAGFSAWAPHADETTTFFLLKTKMSKP